MRSSASVIAFQSTPSAWRETPPDKPEQPAEEISIHSLRMEGDFITCTHYTPIRYFNPLPPHGGRRRCYRYPWKLGGISIHSLRMEGDWWIGGIVHEINYFNPLPPHGGRRDWTEKHGCKVEHFNPLPPHGGRPPRSTAQEKQYTHFNPLPPHGGRPQRCVCCFPAEKAFQSTPSAWRETERTNAEGQVICISIHSLRMEGDL